MKLRKFFILGFGILVLSSILISAASVPTQYLSDWNLNPYMKSGYIDTFHLNEKIGYDNGNLVQGLGIQNRPTNGYLSLNIFNSISSPTNPYYPQGYIITILRGGN